MKKTVVIVNGHSLAGKDETVKQTRIHLEAMGKRCVTYSSIDPFKDAALALGLEPANKTPEMRAFLSEMKASADKHFDYSTSRLNRMIYQAFFGRPTQGELSGLVGAQSGLIDVFFTFIREPHNIDRLRRSFEDAETMTLALLVRGDREVRVESNASDLSVDDYEYDLIINNDGTIEELAEGCRDLAQFIVRQPLERSARTKVTVLEESEKPDGTIVQTVRDNEGHEFQREFQRKGIISGVLDDLSWFPPDQLKDDQPDEA